MHVAAVNLGQPRAVPGKPGKQSGIYKATVQRIEVGVLGVEGDAVVDRRHHGGPSKAVCCYPGQHYDSWRERFPDASWEPGTFGENLTLSGIDEAGVCLGDIWQIGEALAQVSQPRIPCGTLEARVGIRGFVGICLAAGHTGWYLRILRPGAVVAGLPIELRRAHPAGLTVAEANRVLHGGQAGAAEVDALLAVDTLADSWRESLAKLRARLG